MFPGIHVDPVHIHGVLSLVFWSMMIVVTFKYVLIDHEAPTTRVKAEAWRCWR